VANNKGERKPDAGLFVVNNLKRAVPTHQGGWADDGVDIRATLGKIFAAESEQLLDEPDVPSSLANITYRGRTDTKQQPHYRRAVLSPPPKFRCGNSTLYPGSKFARPRHFPTEPFQHVKQIVLPAASDDLCRAVVGPRTSNVAASQARRIEPPTVLGPVKAKPWRVAAKTRPALTGPARDGREICGREECPRRGSNRRMPSRRVQARDGGRPGAIRCGGFWRSEWWMFAEQVKLPRVVVTVGRD
jgi:hypothetical protein